MSYSENQKKFLRQLGHELKPVVLIGQNGLHDNVMNEIEQALLTHELIKIRAAVGDRDERDGYFAKIEKTSQAVLIKRIGHIGLFFRPNKKRKNPIALPRK